MVYRRKILYAVTQQSLVDQEALTSRMNFKAAMIPPNINIGYTMAITGVAYSSDSDLSYFAFPHVAVSNLFNLGRHKVGAQHYRDLRISAFSEWSKAVA